MDILGSLSNRFFLKVFSAKVFDLAGLVIRTDKTKALPLGFNTEIAQVVTEAEIQSAAKRFTVKCDQCGRLMANEQSPRSHKALQCPRILILEVKYTRYIL